VLSRYHGDTGAIWSGYPSADELQRRFTAFTGIGQKKAAMAVEILERDLWFRSPTWSEATSLTTSICGGSSSGPGLPTVMTATT
jgi:hypothetical protein